VPYAANHASYLIDLLEYRNSEWRRWVSTGKPVWAAVSAGNMERLWIPNSVRRVCIYADNDRDSEYDGQASAFILARRLRKEQKKTGERNVEVFVPRHAGTDWADVWLARIKNARQAA
jgi:putative DNA primase/helicase